MSLVTHGLGGANTAHGNASLASSGFGGFGSTPPPDVEVSSIGGGTLREKFPIAHLSSVYQLHKRLV